MDTYRIAYEVLVKGRSNEAVALDLNVTVRTVRNHLDKARKSGMVNVFVTPRIDSGELTNLQLELKAQFPLKDVLVVQGLDEVMDVEASSEKEAVLLSCCFNAAKYLAISLKDRDILAVPWGRVASYIAGYLLPRRKLPNLIVVPMVGVMGIDSNPYEANTIAAKIGTAFGGRHLMLATPAVVDASLFKQITEIPLVKSVLRRLAEANVVLTTIAAPNPETSTIVRKELATRSEVSEMIKLGAVGEIASHWWFDDHGKRIESARTEPIGLGLEGLSRVIKTKGKVIAVVAASRERIKPTRVALENELVNVLITDHISARELLSSSD